ncbi:nuclease-related domain-containing protein [Chromobacterium subtsugae]|uniref:nuclease-related domain-containing protein n=1 Tax=Chromobacterium subtsugae TaxID=251747 RepID=UPI000640D14D|nr:nuclease-related domain-containing protein [Chromobacterium subtsugae]
MILKEKTFTEAKDWKQAAGDAAEKEMAFYLRRYFADDQEVYVLNDVRLELDGDAAQMDHVLIHPAGLTIVESKSVSGRLQMKADGQWLRWFDDRSSGMASPIIQARMQSEFLRKYLRSRTAQPEVIDRLAMDVIVSISSKGQFISPKGVEVPEVCKADQVGERIRAKSQGEVAFPASHRRILGQYLAKMHKPRAEPAPVESAAPMPAAAVAPAKPEAPALQHLAYIGPLLKPAGLLRSLGGGAALRKVYATLCKGCQSQRLEFRYGKFGYYLKCLDCGENTAIRLDCRQCGKQTRLRKQEECLFVECKDCDLSEVLHRNDRPLPELA